MKDAYYFSHDANARHDPKICAMRSVYGSEGYGWYWIIVEVMREQADYRLKVTKHLNNALAMQMQCEVMQVQCYLNDCIDEFGLFSSDGEFIWSESLKRRMKTREEKSEKAKLAAQTRWNKANNTKGLEENDTDAMQTQCKRNADGMQLKERKGNKKEKKSKSINNKYADFVSMTEEEYQKLLEQFGQAGTNDRIERLNLYKGSTGKKYKSDYSLS